jgi:molecular chaperone GrpE
MKKKMHEQEDNRHNNHNESVDKQDNQEQIVAENDQNATADSTVPKSEAESSAEAAADKVVAEVRAVEEKLAEMQDKYIRLSAEFDNYRRRTLREKMELSKYAEENVLLKVLPLMDDFDRALQHMDTSDTDAIKNGINLIYMKFTEFLKQNGIREIEAVDKDFNVDLHEAVAKVHVDEPDKKGKVVDVALKGYFLHDKILRFAKVVVGE